MLTSRYQRKSRNLKYSFIGGTLDREHYLSSLELLKQEELASLVSGFHIPGVEEEIDAFEMSQIDEAERRRSTREKEAEAFHLLIEIERTKQLEERRIMKQLAQGRPPQTLEQERREAKEHFYREESKITLATYQKDYRRYRARHDRWQMAIIISSAMAATVTGTTIFLGATDLSFGLKIAASLLSLIVTIASGSIAYLKYKDRSHDFQKTADTMEEERRAFLLEIGPYRGLPLDDALSLYAENTHKIIKEHHEKQQLLDQPPSAKPEQQKQ